MHKLKDMTCIKERGMILADRIKNKLMKQKKHSPSKTSRKNTNLLEGQLEIAMDRLKSGSKEYRMDLHIW